MGSTRAAFTAGTTHARIEMPASTIVTTTNVSGIARIRGKQQRRNHPRARPGDRQSDRRAHRVSLMLRPITERATIRGDAPMARRIANSRRRRATQNADTP